VIPERILIVGTGSMGRRHFELASRLFPGATVAVYSESERLSEFTNSLITYSEISSFRPQISVIANQASKHMRIANLLGSLNSHLLIEKPLSSDLTGVNDLLILEKEKKLKILVGYNLRFLPSFQKMDSLLIGGEIGRVLDVRIEVGQALDTWRPGRDYQGSTSARKIHGGGVLRELSHELNYLFALFGLPSWVIASALKVSDMEIDVEDIAHLIFGMKDTTGSEFMSTVNLDFIRKDKRRSCTIIGTTGTLEWDLLRGSITKKSSDSSKLELLGPDLELMSDTYESEWLNLIKAINEDLEPVVTLRDSIDTLSVILECEKSQSIGQKIEIMSMNEGRYE
jgi:predicted dehydrogenase